TVEYDYGAGIALEQSGAQPGYVNGLPSYLEYVRSRAAADRWEHRNSIPIYEHAPAIGVFFVDGKEQAPLHPGNPGIERFKPRQGAVDCGRLFQFEVERPVTHELASLTK